jgi:hypothetical protein
LPKNPLKTADRSLFRECSIRGVFVSPVTAFPYYLLLSFVAGADHEGARCA